MYTHSVCEKTTPLSLVSSQHAGTESYLGQNPDVYIKIVPACACLDPHVHGIWEVSTGCECGGRTSGCTENGLFPKIGRLEHCVTRR